MKRSEIFNIVLNKVCEVCEVDACDVLNDCKLQDVVEARALAVHYLKRIGLTNDDIAKIVLMQQSDHSGDKPSIEDIRAKSKSIDKMADAYYKRKDSPFPYAFELLDDEIRQFCRNEYLKYYVAGMAELPN